MRTIIIFNSDSAYTEVLPLMAVINSNVQNNIKQTKNKQITSTKKTCKWIVMTTLFVVDKNKVIQMFSIAEYINKL